MLEYLSRALSVWFLGFFPLAEIYVAVTAAVGLGLDDFSILFWAVLGNFTPVLLIVFGYDSLLRVPRLRAWLGKLSGAKTRARINRYGVWFVLLVTPWVGVWAMTVTAKVVGMQTQRLLVASLTSITFYALATLWLARTGAATF
ncbi:MAG: small multi-drug export protein [Anaerolineae bacterium]|nr:small multi-drug export protein [Anaerolineae bacterium]